MLTRFAHLSVLFSLLTSGPLACSYAEPTGTTDAPVMLEVDGQAVAVSDTLIVAEDGGKVIRSTVNVLGSTRLDIAPGVGTGAISCVNASIGLFNPANGLSDFDTDEADLSCALQVTSNGEGNLYAGSFSGNVVGQAGAKHRINVRWNVRP